MDTWSMKHLPDVGMEESQLIENLRLLREVTQQVQEELAHIRNYREFLEGGDFDSILYYNGYRFTHDDTDMECEFNVCSQLNGFKNCNPNLPIIPNLMISNLGKGFYKAERLITDDTIYIKFTPVKREIKYTEVETEEVVF